MKVFRLCRNVMRQNAGLMPLIFCNNEIEDLKRTLTSRSPLQKDHHGYLIVVAQFVYIPSLLPFVRFHIRGF
jgi:hypothetical protein